jgi:hypothetical protein
MAKNEFKPEKGESSLCHTGLNGVVARYPSSFLSRLASSNTNDRDPFSTT